MRLTDKKGFAARWGRGKRTVEDWLRAGMPHLRLGHRSLVIRVDEADQWVMNKFRVRRFPQKTNAEISTVA
jgi:hypothetical protein